MIRLRKQTPRTATRPQIYNKRPLHLERLERRALMAVLTISDTSATEGDTSALKLLDQFVSPGSGGLARPRYLVFGPDGNQDGAKDLYVADRDLNSVLRYDGVTGASIDTFVTSESGGLNGPMDLVFGPDGALLGGA